MTSVQEEDSLINDELFHLYTKYQLCKVKKNSPSIWNADDSEKNALICILTQCQKLNGNTLHLVMKDIFENSVANFTDNNTSLLVPHSPPIESSSSSSSSKSRVPQVITNATDNDNDLDSIASAEATTSSFHAKTNLSDRVGVKFDNAAVSRRNILPSSTPRLCRSVTPSSFVFKKEKKNEDAIIKKMLTGNAIIDIEQMTYDVGRTKAVLKERMYAVNDSVLVNVSSRIRGTFSVSNCGSCSGTTEKIMYKCQENYLGYRFGKVIEKLLQEYPEEEAYLKAKKYYKELQRELMRHDRTYYTVPWVMFKYYSTRMVRYVNEFGIYCIFIPNIFTPSKLKRMPFEETRVVLQHVDKKFNVFGNIVQVDHEGNIVAPEGHRMNLL